MDKTNFIQKADALVEQAKGKLKGGFFKNLMSAKADRQDEAKELYGQAANCYKLSKAWAQAVECYLRCVELGPENDSDNAGYYNEAAHCIKNINTNKFLEYARIAIDKFALAARLSQAASLAKECAETLEEDTDYEEAIKFYDKAAELYFADETPTQGNQLLVKASDLIILTRDYAQLKIAITNYEKVGKKFLSTPLIKTNAKELFFKAVLCYLASDDLVGARRAIQKYSIDDPNFDSSRELQLLNGIIDAIDAKSEETFIKIVAGFVKMTPFDKVKNQIVAKIKEVHVPDESGLGKVATKFDQLDFTGADDEDTKPKKKKVQRKQSGSDEENKQEDEPEVPKKNKLIKFTIIIQQWFIKEPYDFT